MIDEESSVLVTVVKVLLLVWVIAGIGSCLNKEYHAKTGGAYILPDSTPNTHWLYK
jgi:hypothetical protein